MKTTGKNIADNRTGYAENNSLVFIAQELNSMNRSDLINAFNHLPSSICDERLRTV
jgi:hypothetical protein